MTDKILRRPTLSAETRELYRQQVAKNKPWERTTGPRTSAGKRKVALNRSITGLESQEFAAALRYCDIVLKTLAWVDAG